MANIPEVKLPEDALTPERSPRSDHLLAGRVTLAYAVIAGLWILGSDSLWDTGATINSGWHLVRGIAFVMASAVALHCLGVSTLRRGRATAQERRFFAHLADNARDAIFVADPDDRFRFIYVNTTTAEQLGRNPGDLIGRSIWETIPEISREECSRIWQQLQTGEVPQVQLRLKCPNGALLVAETSLEILAVGQRRLLSGRAWDITARAGEEGRQKELLSQLTESQNRLVEQRTRLEQTTEELDLFNQLAQAFLSHTSPRNLFGHLETILSRAFGAVGSSVALVDDAGESGCGLHFPGKDRPEAWSFEEGQRLTQGTIHSRPVVSVPGPQALPGTTLKVHGLVAVAIRHGDEVLGHIWLGAGEAGFRQDAGGRLERLAGQLAPILRSYLAERRLALEREQTLALALANEAKFTSIFHNSLDALFLVDAATGIIMDCNRQAAVLFAEGESQRLIGLEARCLAVEPRSAAEAAALCQRIAEGFDYEGEVEYRSLGGRVFWGHVAGEQLEIPGARRQLFRIIDITQRKLEERKAGQAARFRQEIMDSVPLPVFVKDTEGRYVEVNRALTEFLGLSREQLLGKTLGAVFPESEAAEFRRRDEEIFLHGGRQVYRGRVRNAAGEIRTVIFHRAAFHGGDQALGGLIGTFLDVTDSDLALQRLRLQETALRAAANGIIITDRSGMILWANPACEPLTGFSPEELVGASVRILKSGAQDTAFYRNLWETVLSGNVWQGEIINRRKDGTLYHEETTITPVRDESGAVSHFISIKQDITSRKQVELQYLRAQRMEGIGLLASGIAHDLNNVLAPVLLSIELLQAMHQDADTQEILHTVEQSARRGADIVRQVLTFARGVKGERIPLQSKHLVKDIVRVAKETFPKNIEVHVRMDTEVANVEGDPTQIHQVLLNLAVNARDAMPDGGRITLSAHNLQVREALSAINGTIPLGEYVVLGVKDTGIGIAAEYHQRLFEPFFTTKSANKGTGLGLPTSLGIVKSHNGFFRVLSEPGKGAEFLVYLPATHRDEASPAPASPAAPRGNGETVLVVDDEPGIRSITSEILSRHGYRVLIAADGTDAMALVAQHRGKVEVVVTDVMMPHMDGVALVRSLRKLAPNTRVVAFSGLSKDPTLAPKIEELRRLGLPPVLSKPLAAPELLTAVHEVLNSSPQSA